MAGTFYFTEITGSGVATVDELRQVIIPVGATGTFDLVFPFTVKTAHVSAMSQGDQPTLGGIMGWYQWTADGAPAISAPHIFERATAAVSPSNGIISSAFSPPTSGYLLVGTVTRVSGTTVRVVITSNGTGFGQTIQLSVLAHS